MYFTLLNSLTCNPSSKATATTLQDFTELNCWRIGQQPSPTLQDSLPAFARHLPMHNLMNLSFTAAPLRPMVRKLVLLSRLCATNCGNISPKLPAPASISTEPRGAGMRTWGSVQPRVGAGVISSKDPRISMETPHKLQGTGLPPFFVQNQLTSTLCWLRTVGKLLTGTFLPSTPMSLSRAM